MFITRIHNSTQIENILSLHESLPEAKSGKFLLDCPSVVESKSCFSAGIGKDVTIDGFVNLITAKKNI